MMGGCGSEIWAGGFELGYRSCSGVVMGTESRALDPSLDDRFKWRFESQLDSRVRSRLSIRAPMGENLTVVGGKLVIRCSLRYVYICVHLVL